MMGDGVKEILARLEPALSEIAREQTRQAATLACQRETLARIDERSTATPSFGGVVGLILGTNAGIIAGDALLARMFH